MNDSPDRSADGPPDPADGTDVEDHDAGASMAERVLFLFALALVTAGLGAALFVWSNPDEEPDPSPDDVPGLEDDNDAVADGAVGPEPGTEIEPYVAERVAAVDAAEGDRVAIVSFDSYLAEDVASRRLADIEVGVLLVAFPGGSETATDDLTGLREELTAEAETQLPELRSILPTVDDPEFADFYAAEIERYEQILRAGSTPEVVFGAIVRADADVLRDLASSDGVRLVDVGDSHVLRHDAALRGLRPEETSTVGDPPVRPAG